MLPLCDPLCKRAGCVANAVALFMCSVMVYDPCANDMVLLILHVASVCESGMFTAWRCLRCYRLLWRAWMHTCPIIARPSLPVIPPDIIMTNVIVVIRTLLAIPIPLHSLHMLPYVDLCVGHQVGPYVAPHVGPSQHASTSKSLHGCSKINSGGCCHVSQASCAG
jgi:hypothetical protein